MTSWAFPDRNYLVNIMVDTPYCPLGGRGERPNPAFSGLPGESAAESKASYGEREAESLIRLS